MQLQQMMLGGAEGGVCLATCPLSLLARSVFSGQTTVAEVPYMEGFICKRKSYVDTGRV